jgi:hypothetical protein
MPGGKNIFMHERQEQDNMKNICIIGVYAKEFNVKSIELRSKELIDLVNPYTNKIYFITNKGVKHNIFNKDVEIININNRQDFPWFFLKVLNHIRIQMNIFMIMMHIIRDIDIIIWRTRLGHFFIPMVFARIYNKKIILYIESIEST